MYFFFVPLSLSHSLSLPLQNHTSLYRAKHHHASKERERESNKERAFESNNKERSSIEGNSSRVHPTKREGGSRRGFVCL